MGTFNTTPVLRRSPLWNSENSSSVDKELNPHGYFYFYKLPISDVGENVNKYKRRVKLIKYESIKKIYESIYKVGPLLSS